MNRLPRGAVVVMIAGGSAEIVVDPDAAL